MDVEKIFEEIKSKHNSNFDLKQEQKKIIDLVLNGQSVSGVLPTGYGKSMCYILPPLLLNQRDQTSTNLSLVVSPLISLMMDQMKELEAHGVKSVSTTHGHHLNFEELSSSPVSVAFVTPEMLRTNALRKLLLNKTFKDRVCVVAVDEAHCVSEWGENFRPEYREIGSVRSFIDAPMLALTATTTELVQEDVRKYLLLADDTVTVAKVPNRPNIVLSVKKAKQEFEEELQWFKEYAESATEMKKTIIFCRSYTSVYAVWSWLTESVDINLDRKTRTVEMFHSCTDEDTKDRILNDFRQTDSTIKVVVCTIAFGMGISIPNVEIVLHWGCPKNPLAYWQELGRAGRLGQPALGIVYAYPRSLIKRYTEDNIIKIVNGDKCIRISVLEHLMTAGMNREDMPTQSPCADLLCVICECHLCTCCNVCWEKCQCAGKMSCIDRFLL